MSRTFLYDRLLHAKYVYFYAWGHYVEYCLSCVTRYPIPDQVFIYKIIVEFIY